MNRIELYRDPQLMANAREMGDAFARSRMFGCETPEQGVVIAVEMIVNNRSPFEMFQTYHIINTSKGAKVTKQAAAMLAHFNELGGQHRVVQFDERAACIEFKYNGQILPVTVDWQMAQKESWPWSDGAKTKLKATWATPLGRASMMIARCITRGIRAIAPAVNHGQYAPEEIDDTVPTENQSNFVPTGGMSLLPEHAQSAYDHSPCTQAQIDMILTLARRIGEKDQDFAQRLRDKLHAMGKSKISELSLQQAESLHQALLRKEGMLHIGGMGESQPESPES